MAFDTHVYTCFVVEIEIESLSLCQFVMFVNNFRYAICHVSLLVHVLVASSVINTMKLLQICLWINKKNLHSNSLYTFGFYNTPLPNLGDYPFFNFPSPLTTNQSLTSCPRHTINTFLSIVRFYV